MMNKLDEYLVAPETLLVDVLQKIEHNHKGFLIVVDSEKRLFGVVTDGDIRRHLIKTGNLMRKVEEVCVKSPKKIYLWDTLGDAIELFKTEGIRFLPILAEGEEVVNVINRRQLEYILLHDMCVDLSYDFISINESVLEHEIYYRPWGLFKTTMINEYFQSKMIIVYPKGRLSLQYHNHREEYWVIVHGNGMAELGESVIEVKSGSMIFIPKGVKHRIINCSDSENLVFSEVQIGEYFGEDDIVRIEDSYGRVDE